MLLILKQHNIKLICTFYLMKYQINTSQFLEMTFQYLGFWTVTNIFQTLYYAMQMCCVVGSGGDLFLDAFASLISLLSQKAMEERQDRTQEYILAQGLRINKKCFETKLLKIQLRTVTTFDLSLSPSFFYLLRSFFYLIRYFSCSLT